MAGFPNSRSRARLYLRLGRVSNLPTVWTNVLAGSILAGAAAEPSTELRLLVSLSLFYVGGMFLNDAFDRAIDARERPERPIPSGAISATEVFVVGFGLLAMGLAGLAANALARSEQALPSLASGAALGGLVVLYDAWHKENPLSPVVMGLCRAAVYTTAGLGAGGSLRPPLILGALVLASYVVGLTFVARQENRRSYRAGGTLLLIFSPVLLSVTKAEVTPVAWAALAAFAAWAVATVGHLFKPKPVIPRAVVRLIAGISLLDALLMASNGAPAVALLGVPGFLATLALQRWVSGT
jgi:4-hydroxybenzoate polyprenyltransferase